MLKFRSVKIGRSSAVIRMMSCEMSVLGNAIKSTTHEHIKRFIVKRNVWDDGLNWFAKVFSTYMVFICCVTFKRVGVCDFFNDSQSKELKSLCRRDFTIIQVSQTHD